MAPTHMRRERKRQGPFPTRDVEERKALGGGLDRWGGGRKKKRKGPPSHPCIEMIEIKKEKSCSGKIALRAPVLGGEGGETQVISRRDGEGGFSIVQTFAGKKEGRPTNLRKKKRKGAGGDFK